MPPHSPVQPLLTLWRRHGQPLLARVEDPHAELMTLVWGPKFDRAHAAQLLQSPGAAADVPPQVQFAVRQAASLFDQLAPAQQQRVRRLILQHHAYSPTATRWGTMPHATHPAH